MNSSMQDPKIGEKIKTKCVHILKNWKVLISKSTVEASFFLVRVQMFHLAV